MINDRRLRLLPVIVLVGLAVTGCGTKTATKPHQNTVHWMQANPISSMDISKMTDLVSDTTLNATNEGLLRVVKGNKLIPGVAKSYHVSKDGLTWTFQLRHSKWSDGTPVTAKNFVYSWRRTVAPKTAGQFAYTFDHIKNATAINQGKDSPKQLGVQAIGNYRLVVHLVKPQSYFKYLVSQAYFFPQSAAAVKKFGARYGTSSQRMIYNGPFKLTGWNGTNDTWNLVKNPEYWNPASVKPTKIAFQVEKDPATALNQYQSHKLDSVTLSGQQVAQYRHDKNLHLRKNAQMWFLEMNQKKEAFFRNVNIRKAISLSINRKQLTNHVLQDGSTPSKGFVALGLGARHGVDFANAAEVTSSVTDNHKQALTYWRKGLRQTGHKSVSYSLLIDDTDTAKRTGEFIQSELSALPGFHVTTSSMPFKSRLTRSANGQFDMVLSSWTGDYPDPMTSLSNMTSHSSYNHGKWHNARYDQLIAKAEGQDATNPAKRWADMVAAEKTLANDQGVVVLYQAAIAQLVRSNIKGIQFFPESPQWDWRNVTVK
nr:peptide ABC transporter substrate-binding protein [Lentilactobacillus parafarraginis]